MNRSGSSTPSGSLTARGNNFEFSSKTPLASPSVSRDNNNDPALQETREILQKQMQHMNAEVEARQSELRQLNQEPDLAAIRAEKRRMEQYLQALNGQVVEKRREQEFARQE